MDYCYKMTSLGKKRIPTFISEFSFYCFSKYNDEQTLVILDDDRLFYSLLLHSCYTLNKDFSKNIFGTFLYFIDILKNKDKYIPYAIDRAERLKRLILLTHHNSYSRKLLFVCYYFQTNIDKSKEFGVDIPPPISWYSKLSDTFPEEIINIIHDFNFNYQNHILDILEITNKKSVKDYMVKWDRTKSVYD